MHKLFLSVLIGLFAITAQGVNVLYKFGDTTNGLPYLSEVTVTAKNAPSVVDGLIIVNEAKRFKTDTNGQVTVNNTVPMKYAVHFALAGKNTVTDFEITVTNSLSDTSTIFASDIITAPTNSSAPGTVAYSMASMDALLLRYAAKTNPTLYGTISLGVSSTLNYVWTATGTTGAGAWAAAQGGGITNGQSGVTLRNPTFTGTNGSAVALQIGSLYIYTNSLGTTIISNHFTGANLNNRGVKIIGADGGSELFITRDDVFWTSDFINTNGGVFAQRFGSSTANFAGDGNTAIMSELGGGSYIEITNSGDIIFQPNIGYDEETGFAVYGLPTTIGTNGSMSIGGGLSVGGTISGNGGGISNVYRIGPQTNMVSRSSNAPALTLFGGFLNTNTATGTWSLLTNGNFKLGPTNTAATITLDGTGGQITASGYSGPASGLTSLPAGQLTGSIADARFSGNVPLKDAANTFTGIDQFTNSVGSGVVFERTTNAWVVFSNGVAVAWCDTNGNLGVAGNVMVGSGTQSNKFSVLGGADSKTAFFQNNNASGHTKVMIQAGAGNSAGGTTDPVLSVMNSGGTQVSYVRSDGQIGAVFLATQDDMTATLVDTTGAIAARPPGLNLGATAIVGWGSTAWYDTKDLVLSKLSAGRLGIGSSTNSPSGGSLSLSAVTASNLTATNGFISPLYTPASSAETNFAGAVRWDANYIYVWTSTTVNKRVALTTW